MMHARVWAGAMMLGLGLWFVGLSNAADDKDGLVISEADLGKLVAKSVDEIQKALKAGKEKKHVTRAKVQAVMIAAAAQGAGAGNVRDAAIKLAETIKGGKLDDAKKQAEELGALKPEKGKADHVAILKKTGTEVSEVMRQFSPTAIGGFGLEATLKKLSTSKKLSEAQMSDDFVLTALQMAAIADLIKDAPPAKNPKEYVKMADEFRAMSASLAESAKPKDGVKSAATLYKLTIHCNKCHDRYRE